VFDDPDAHPYLQQYLEHYTRALAAGGRYALTIWPFHAMLGGIGHALAPIIEEAAFFHAAARQSRVDYRIKGNNPLSENYSVLSPEVLADHCGAPVAEKNSTFIEKLMRFDAILIAGQAKSHCVAWSIDSLLCEINAKDPALAKKVYLLEDCTSPVVVPGIVDFTDQADAAFNRFAEAGMRVVRSTEPMDSWPGFHKSVE
jgi:nicotinamidase-related amidase